MHLIDIFAQVGARGYLMDFHLRVAEQQPQ
jgi:hypothetical protein